MNEMAMQELDVRPILQAGGEPFDVIMKFVDGLRPGEAFRLWATFRPDPLLAQLRSRGYRHLAHEHADGSWDVVFSPAE